MLRLGVCSIRSPNRKHNGTLELLHEHAHIRTWYAMYSGAAPVLISLRLVSGFFTMERATRRPMRPKPLIPVSTAMDSCVGDEGLAPLRAAPFKALGATKAEADPARAMAAAALSTGAIVISSFRTESMKVWGLDKRPSALRTGGKRFVPLRMHTDF